LREKIWFLETLRADQEEENAESERIQQRKADQAW
jgi:hypothetical protein